MSTRSASSQGVQPPAIAPSCGQKQELKHSCSFFPQVLLASEPLIPVLERKGSGEGSLTLRIMGGTRGCWDVGLEGGSQEKKEKNTRVTDSLTEGLSGQ